MKAKLAYSGLVLWVGSALIAFLTHEGPAASLVILALLFIGYVTWLICEAIAAKFCQAINMVESDVWAIFTMGYLFGEAMLPSCILLSLLLCLAIAFATGVSWSVLGAWLLSMIGGALLGMATAEEK